MSENRGRLERATLKWYEIRRPDAPMPAGLEHETRSFVRDEVEAGRLDASGQPGFGDHAATYCVWELAVVWHERNAWNRFLDSARDEAALEVYLADGFAGLV